jgi:ABC-type nitrate/sulfonate/bicarbonate transport system substrate-binding protein
MKHKSIFSKAAFVGAAFLSATIALSGFSTTSTAQGLKTVRVGMSWIPNVEYGGVWLGLEKGYFAKENLDIKYFPGGPNAPKPLVTLAAGKIDIGYGGWLPFLDAVSRGNDFVLIAATFSVSPLGILSLGSDPIRKASDLVGKKILAQGAKERKAITATLKLNNLPNKWQAVPAGYSPEPLLNKQGAGYTAFGTNQAVALELKGLKRGKDFHFVSFADMGYRSYGSIIFTTRKYLKQNRATVVSFLRGLTRGWQDNALDPKVAANLAVKKYGADLGLNPKQQLRQNQIQINMMKDPKNPSQKLLVIDPATIAGPLYAAAKASGRKNLPPVSQLADATLMQEVYNSLK